MPESTKNVEPADSNPTNSSRAGRLWILIPLIIIAAAIVIYALTRKG